METTTFDGKQYKKEHTASRMGYVKSGKPQEFINDKGLLEIHPPNNTGFIGKSGNCHYSNRFHKVTFWKLID